jgi:hypothetical protein
VEKGNVFARYPGGSESQGSMAKYGAMSLVKSEYQPSQLSTKDGDFRRKGEPSQGMLNSKYGDAGKSQGMMNSKYGDAGKSRAS